MSEKDEFAEALLAQLSVEINEEKEIESLSKKIKEDNEFKVEFGDTEKIAQTLLPDLIQRVNEYMGLSVSPDLSIVGLELEELKRFKGKKVFTTKAARQFVDELFYAVSKNDLEKISDSIKKDTTKFLVYSTYVKSYISKISTTYGDFLDNTIYLNKFVLDNYPKIILYKQRPPYEPKFESVKSGYMGALKMTILEEIVHSVQNNLQRLNKVAVIQVNEINEELARTILELDDSTVSQLSEYLQLQLVPEEFADVYKGDYAHFTLKEISEQPDTVLRSENNDQIQQFVDNIKQAKNLYITGSGTSYNAAEIAKYLMSKFAKIKINTVISSEFPFSPDDIEQGSTLIAISQSGESADVLDAVRIARKSNTNILSIVNHLNSSLSQESSLVIGLNCGPEIGVAATKSFTSQLVSLYKITDKLCNGCINPDWEKVSAIISQILSDHSKIKEIARNLKEISDIYVLGRGIHLSIAREAALKLKELSYIHAEGIPGGELKHGPLALMDSNVYVIIINPNDSTYNDTMNSANEIKARGAKIIGISDKKSDVYDYWIEIPPIDEILYPIIEIIPIQLLAYYTALEKKTNPDYPRNLAKSVTVK